METRIPVIIPAFNEEAYIGRTLLQLDPKLVQPFVMVNGEQRDRTIDVARSHAGRFGLEPNQMVPDPIEQGKLPAMQEALRRLGSRALGPVIFTDADTRAVRPAVWPVVMTEAVDTATPSFAAGPVGIIDGNFVSDALRNTKSLYQARKRSQSGQPYVSGANLAVSLRQPELLEEVLALPHVWPGEDRMLADTILRAGGTGRQLTGISSMVLASGRYGRSLTERLIHGRGSVIRKVSQGYSDRIAPGAVGGYVSQDPPGSQPKPES